MNIQIDLTALTLHIDGLERIRMALMSQVDELRRIGKALPQDTMQVHVISLHELADNLACDGDTIVQMMRYLDETILRYRNLLDQSLVWLHDIDHVGQSRFSGTCSPAWLMGSVPCVVLGKVRNRLLLSIAKNPAVVVTATPAGSGDEEDSRAGSLQGNHASDDVRWNNLYRQLLLTDITQEERTDTLRRSGAYEPAWLVDRTIDTITIERSATLFIMKAQGYLNGMAAHHEVPTLEGVLQSLGVEIPVMDGSPRPGLDASFDTQWHQIDATDGAAFAQDGYPVVMKVASSTGAPTAAWKLLVPSDMQIDASCCDLLDTCVNDKVVYCCVHR